MTRGEKRNTGDAAAYSILLIEFFLLLIIFQVSFSFNLLVANWRLSPEFWSANIFSLAMATKMVAAWSAAKE